jgi:hypothetical protein
MLGSAMKSFACIIGLFTFVIRIDIYFGTWALTGCVPLLICTDLKVLTVQDKSCYTPWVNKYMLDEVNHVGPRKSIIQQLGERGVSADEIDSVLFRYLQLFSDPGNP